MEENDRPDNSHEHLTKVLRARIRDETSEGPVTFLKFIVDPNSFSASIENMFALSHLVKEGWARHFMEDGQQMIRE